MTNPTLVDDLRAVRALIDKPQKWCRGEYSKGHRRCLVAAVDGAVIEARRWHGVSAAIREEAAPLNPADFNDRRKHKDVLALIDRAIARAEGGE